MAPMITRTLLSKSLAGQADDDSSAEFPSTNGLENTPKQRHSIGKEINLESLKIHISEVKASMEMNDNCQETLAQKYLRTDMLLYRSMHNNFVRVMNVEFERYKKLKELYLATVGRNGEATTIRCETGLRSEPERKNCIRSSRLDC